MNIYCCKFTVTIFVKKIYVLELEYTSGRKTKEKRLTRELAMTVFGTFSVVIKI